MLKCTIIYCRTSSNSTPFNLFLEVTRVYKDRSIFPNLVICWAVKAIESYRIDQTSAKGFIKAFRSLYRDSLGVNYNFTSEAIARKLTGWVSAFLIHLGLFGESSWGKICNHEKFHKKRENHLVRHAC